MAARLTVLAVLALLGSVSCQGGYGDGNPAPAPQRKAYPPIRPQPAASPPTTSSPPSYPPTSSSPPPPKITKPPTPPSNPNSLPPKGPQAPAYPPPSPKSPPPKAPQAPVYPLPSPKSPPPKAPQAPAYPPPSSKSPPPKAPQAPAYPPTTLSPPPPKVPQPAYPPPSSSSPPPQPSQSPTYPPMSPSPLPPKISQPPTYPPPSSSPPPPILPQSPNYPPTSPSPPPPIPPPPPSSGDAGEKLEVGYYKNKCDDHVDVEAIVRKHVSSFDDGMKAGLIRLFFHDCFIRGCDASILLDPTSDNQQPEKFGIPNFPSMRGYEVIDAAKTEVEATCPGKVSCADIIAFAARDATFLLSGGGINFDMPAGRYDGNVSLASETLPNLPPPFAGLQQLEKMFADKGLNSFDMVTLSGAHSIGRSHCSSFSRDRLPPSTTSDMDPAFAAGLQANCTSANGADNTVVEDHETPDILDNQFYQNVLDRKVLFTSDAELTSKDMTNNLVRVYAIFPWLWQQKFEEAMVKMSRIEVKTAATGEIRRTCRAVNSKP